MESGLILADKSVNRAYVPDFSKYVLPYTQWYQDDFLGGVRGMSAAEIGVYTILLNEMYARGEALSLPDVRLARHCGLPVPKFRTILAMLIKEGKIVELECGLWNEKCDKTLVKRKNEHHRNSSAGSQSGKNRNEINDGDERALSDGSTPVQPSSEAQISRRRRSSAPAHARTREDDPPPLESELTEIPEDGVKLYENVMAAVGIGRSGSMPSYWLPPGAIMHVIRWRALGLFDDEIVEVARQSRRNHPEPPNGPMALDRVMQISAAYKTRTNEIPKSEGQGHGRRGPDYDVTREIIRAAARGTT